MCGCGPAILVVHQRGLRPRQPALTGNGGTTMWPALGNNRSSPSRCAFGRWREIMSNGRPAQSVAVPETPQAPPGSSGADPPALGVYGFGGSEPVILAALVTEDPLLLIGASGTGKTDLSTRCRRDSHPRTPTRQCEPDLVRRSRRFRIPRSRPSAASRSISARQACF